MKPTKDELKKIDKVFRFAIDGLKREELELLRISTQYPTRFGKDPEEIIKDLNIVIGDWLLLKDKLTEKAKTYGYEDCIEDNKEYYNNDWGYATEEGLNQAKAAAKLSFVVAKINEDFPRVDEQIWKSFFPLFEGGEFRLIGTDAPEVQKCPVVSFKGCEILLRDNEQLLKQLYDVE